ncbi:phage portal protein [Nocardioides bruguierae]|uniref:Phage portal protein n=1 Tax=Nocardioides bruguierae TaxID=2945102 RepID=A0A9X2DB44_9ACTN|nr:phage portal protein [Nocardioides bruguierae]MCM0622501.1 phage portal protein [Nocardioides bruguierae]
MPIDVEVRNSPGWWFNTLATQLHDRRVGRDGRRRWNRAGVASSKVRPPLLLLDDYLRGDPPLHDDIHAGWAEPFRRYVRMGRLNIAGLAVSSPATRMGIRDFRTAAADDELGDVEARRLMRRNKLKVKIREIHETCLALGDAYAIVIPPDGGRSHALITAESPLECITAEDPQTGETLAGLKLFRDETNDCDWAYLFLPGRLLVARLDGATSLRRTGMWRFSKGWEWVDAKADTVPGGRVAMVRFRNKDGVGEFERHLDSLDRMNDKLFNEWWISKIQAFRQRAVKLPDEDSDDLLEDAEATADAGIDDENPLYSADADLSGIFTSAPDAMWRLPKDAEIWESQNVDVTPLVNSIKTELEHFAAALAIPLYSITPDSADGSAEGATAMREEHVNKVQDRRDRTEGSWAETLAMAFLFQGDTERADVSQIECLWAPIERFSLGEMSQAASQLAGILPREAIWTDILQYSPADVQERLRDQWAAQQATDLLYAATSATSTGATGAGSGTQGAGGA